MERMGGGGGVGVGEEGKGERGATFHGYCSLYYFDMWLCVQSIKEFMGEAKLKTFINFCLKYIADLDIPMKR